MARPKQNEDAVSAYRRIITAFWEMLEEKSYSKVTISGLSKKAEVNHNLIYYYFDNKDDLAKKAFYINMVECEPQILIDSLLSGKLDTQAVLSDQKRIAGIKRMQLFMRDESSYLNGIVKKAIINEWLKAANLDKDSLSVEDRIDLNFIISGLIAVLGSKDFMQNLQDISKITERSLGKGITETLRKLKERSKKM